MNDLLKRILTAAAAGWPVGHISEDDVRKLAAALDGNADEAVAVYNEAEEEAKSDVPPAPQRG